MAIYRVYLTRTVTQTTVVQIEGNSPALAARMAPEFAPSAYLWKTAQAEEGHAYRVDSVTPEGGATVWRVGE